LSEPKWVKEAHTLFNHVENLIDTKRTKGYNPTWIQCSIHNFELLQRYADKMSTYPMRHEMGFTYVSLYGVRLVAIPTVHDSFIQVLCEDEVMK